MININLADALAFSLKNLISKKAHIFEHDKSLNISTSDDPIIWHMTEREWEEDDVDQISFSYFRYMVFEGLSKMKNIKHSSMEQVYKKIKESQNVTVLHNMWLTSDARLLDEANESINISHVNYGSDRIKMKLAAKNIVFFIKKGAIHYNFPDIEVFSNETVKDTLYTFRAYIELMVDDNDAEVHIF